MQCDLCDHYRWMKKVDPHFAPQYEQSLEHHRLYGVCREKVQETVLPKETP